jgi:hypothetical protein
MNAGYPPAEESRDRGRRWRPPGRVRGRAVQAAGYGRLPSGSARRSSYVGVERPEQR